MSQAAKIKMKIKFDSLNLMLNNKSICLNVGRKCHEIFESNGPQNYVFVVGKKNTYIFILENVFKYRP